MTIAMQIHLFDIDPKGRARTLCDLELSSRAGRKEALQVLAPWDHPEACVNCQKARLGQAPEKRREVLPLRVSPMFLLRRSPQSGAQPRSGLFPAPQPLPAERRLALVLPFARPEA